MERKGYLSFVLRKKKKKKERVLEDPKRV